MSSANGWILLSHGHQAFLSIDENELLAAIPSEIRDGWRHPIRIDGTVPMASDAAGMDWAALQREQAALVEETNLVKLRDEGRGIAYFGRTLLPLAMDLGYRLEGWAAQSCAFVYHARSRSWRWPGRAAQESAPNVMLEHNLPNSAKPTRGDVVIRVSVSNRIAPAETRAVLPHPLAEVDIHLGAACGWDALASSEELELVVVTFDRAIHLVKERCPQADALHVFASVPAGLAFRMGNVVNHKVHPPIHIYQYVRNAPVRYQRALVLGALPGTTGKERAPMRIKIQFLAAAPRTNGLLQVETELKKIRSELRDSEHRDRFHGLLQPRLAVHRDEIQKHLRRDEPNIVHFSGHGADMGHLVLEDAYGNPDYLRPDALREYFRVANKQGRIRCVVLNAGFSHIAAEELVREPAVVPCVVATKDAIADWAAITFARAFYSALADGIPLGDAFEIGRAEVFGERHPGAREQANHFALYVAEESMRELPIFSL